MSLKLQVPNKAKQFVCIQGNKYSFYLGNLHVITIQSDDMTAEWLEEYRKNHQHIFHDINPEPTTA